jgi:hypothetical protein
MGVVQDMRLPCVWAILLQFKGICLLSSIYCAICLLNTKIDVYQKVKLSMCFVV